MKKIQKDEGIGAKFKPSVALRAKQKALLKSAFTKGEKRAEEMLTKKN